MHLQNWAGNTTGTNIPIKETDCVILKISARYLSLTAHSLNHVLMLN